MKSAVVFNSGSACFARSSRCSASAETLAPGQSSPRSHHLFLDAAPRRRVLHAIGWVLPLSANFPALPASSATMSSAIRLPICGSLVRNRASRDSIAWAISPTGSASARNAFFGPIPLTVMNSSKNAIFGTNESNQTRRHVAAGCVPCNVKNRVKGDFGAAKRIQLGEIRSPESAAQTASPRPAHERALRQHAQARR